MAVTELEGVILGIVSSRQPCSANMVRRRFEESPTWGWSKSKGAIYPAVARLVKRGYLASEQASGNSAAKELVRLTQSGEAALAEWIMAIGEEMGGAPVDPIRTRVNYLGSLSPPQRDTFLQHAEKAARNALTQAIASLPDPEAAQPWGLQAATLGVQMHIKTKIRWLRRVRELVEKNQT